MAGVPPAKGGGGVSSPDANGYYGQSGGHLHNSYVRDQSTSRGRGPGLPATPNLSVNSSRDLTSRALSPRTGPSGPEAGSRPGTATGHHNERRRSGNYGHYRQASTAQSTQKHSRDNSQANGAWSFGGRPLGGIPSSTSEYEGGSDTHSETRNQAAAQSQHSENGSASNHSVSPQKADSRTTAKPRKEHGRTSSKANTDLRSVGEYALHHLFNSFVGKADLKINQCVASIPESVAKVEDICGPGADKDFDSLISALGHIARQKPKHLVDTIMYWRKAKSEEAQTATAHWNALKASNPYFRSMHRRNTEASVSSSTDFQSPVSADDPVAAAMKQAESNVHQADRKLSLSIYLICRVLIEVYQQSDLESITSTLDERLEDLIFDQLSRLDPARVEASPFHFANWSIYGQLLGVMSTLNFPKVSKRFVTILRHAHDELPPKGTVAHEQEARLELMIRAMHYACIDAFPEGRWLESCDFMYSISKFFADSHGLSIKHAYCDVLEALVFPVAASPGPQLVSPRWKEFLNLLNSRLGSMLVKPKHWSDAFSLSTLLLCSSPMEIFTTQWMSSITSLQGKLKDRNTRPVALQAIARIVWTYLRRFGDQNNTMRKLEDVVKIVLPSGKKTLLSTDPAIAEPIIDFIRIIGYYHPEFAFKTIIFPLMNAELFNTHKDIKTDQLDPERIVIGIRAFLAIIGDLEKPPGERKPPQLPQFDKGGRIPEDPPSQRSKNYLSQFDRKKILPTSEEALSKTVNVSNLDDRIREYFGRFCDILSKVTIVCDNTFGGQATLDEKFGGQTPKTPIDTFSFSRREETSAVDYRQGFYELLYVATQALPRCLPKDINFNALINLLCTGTAHVQGSIASSSARSLKAIARQTHAQQVTMGFARFIFNFDVRYSTMSDEGLLGPGHIESTLQLYLELLKIWIEEIKRKTKQAQSVQSPDPVQTNRSIQLDLATVSAHVDELESHGVFFLCSQSRRVRGFAVSVLRLITEFDDALGQRQNSRVIQILERDLCDVISPEDETLNAAEKARLQKSRRKAGDKSTLLDICSSEVSYDSSLWSKVFPSLMRMISEHCVNPVYIGRDIVCARLLQMLPVIQTLSEGHRPGQSTTPYDRPSGARLGTTGPEIIIEQWKIYLVMACTTLRDAGGQSQAQLANSQHARNKSKVVRQGSKEIGSARSLFAAVIPLLHSSPASLREAVVTALGSISTNMYRTLLESLQYAVTTCVEEARMRMGVHHQRSGSNPRPRDRKTEILRTEVTHVYKLTAKFLQEPDIQNDEWILANLIKYTDEIRGFLSGEDIQSDWEVNTLKKHFCGLLEEIFEAINRTRDPARWMTFESRRAAFTLIEDWCGFSPNQHQINVRDEGLKQLAISQHYETGDRSNVASNFEVAKRDLRLSALSAMASLCAGPIGAYGGGARGVVQSFNVQRILTWAEQIFNTQTDKMHLSGRRALKNLILHNSTYPKLLEQVMDKCLGAPSAKALESYFEVVAAVLSEQPEYPVPFWRIIVFVLFALGNEKSSIRTKAAKALRSMETREQKTSKLQDFEISTADKTTAVYKVAQYQISLRLAKQHSDIAFFVFSQWSQHYKAVHADHQRNMIHGILPWLQNIELELNTDGGPTSQTYMLLANLLEITTRASTSLHNEMQGMWSALANGNAGNVQLTLDFIISLCIERREQSFVEYAKQIVVFLSSTQAGQKVVEFLLLQITPRNMVHTEKKPMEVPPDTVGLPYVADLGEVLPVGNRQNGLALGQISLILLVDLMIAPLKLTKDQLPLLLQVCTVLWDHYTPLVQEEAREMLVHLIHELVISQIDENTTTTPTKDSIEDFVEAIRQSKADVVWSYQDNKSKTDEGEGARVPDSMSYVTNEIINLFSLTYPNIHEQWAKTTLSWATSCSVRHLACRSFQIFRCILSSLDQPMLADMLARLSNTIADEAPEVQSFSMEILTTLRTIIGALEPPDLIKYPQLFWVTCACLDTVNEREFIETLGMLESLLSRVDLSDPAVIKILNESKPARWEGEFEGIMPLVYRGLRSGESYDKAMAIIDKTISLPGSELIGDEGRLLFNLLSYLPLLLRSFDPDDDAGDWIAAVENLITGAENEEHHDIANVLSALIRSRYASSKEFLSKIVTAVRQCFFPKWEFKTLVFLIGQVTNKISWFKLNSLEILCYFIPVIDMRSAEAATHGPDLISPLLRLLQTEYCPQALKVMDLIMTMNGTPMEKHHLRMSMVMSGSTKSIRKEFERTQSLYGIPEETGWSIPMPAVHSSNTRANVHAVFFTCAGQSASEGEPAATPEIEFDQEDEHTSYFPTDRADTIMSDETRVESVAESMSFSGATGDLASKLKSLDDFFDDEDEEGNDDKYLSRYSDITVTGLSPDPDRGASLYDQQTAPILNHTLARTASVTSLHNPYIEIRGPGIMNPGAFSSHSANQSVPVAPLQQRPGLHTRSITSPSNQLGLATDIDTLSESENEHDGVFSDDERSTGYNTPPVFETAMRRTRSAAGKKFGSGAAAKEYRQGDLLRGQSRLRSKSQAPNSPEVPKVPEAYLNLSKPDS